MARKTGIIYLIGAGPGDPGLITIKGAECIKKADTIVYDYLATVELLEYASKDAELIYVGKKGSDHTLTQDKINQLLVDKGLEGRVVARLKGGDPFIFGRGGEEIEEITKAGIAFEVVPGVTSAVSAPAYAGIPLTHRKFTSTVAFVTGHEDPTKKDSGIDWASLAKGIGTIVFLMGIKNLPNVVENLINNGRAESTPAAVIRWGTKPVQRTVVGTLGNIEEKVLESGIKPPAVIVVGEVVSLRGVMNWFEKKPLFGKRIVVTRARAQASDLTHELALLGAEIIECPTIKIVPPEDFSPMDDAIKRIEQYSWIVFTSVNGVESFYERLYALGLDSRCFGGLKTASIGPATAQKLKSFGINSDIIPETYRAESVVKAFESEQVKGKKILLPRAEEARPVLPVELTAMGAVVDEVTAYRTIVDGSCEDVIKESLKTGVDLITFTSSSTVKNFMSLIQTQVDESGLEEVIGNAGCACIGPITADTASDMGLKPTVIADTFTIPGLCSAIIEHFSKA